MASSDITVVTSITDSKDELRDGQEKGNAKFVAFTDFQSNTKEWDVKPAYAKFADPRRNSRIHKILIHQYVDTKYSIWIDGNIRLMIPPEELVELYLKDHDIALWRHPNRDCIYDEAIKCAARGLDDPETIIEQAKKYEDSGYTKHRGLFECGMIIRRHTPKVIEFDNAWWAEYCRHSRRDQISFPYAADLVGLRVNKALDYFIYADDGVTAIRGAGIADIIPHQTTT